MSENKTHDCVLGFGELVIKPGEEAGLNVQPHMNFLVKRLEIPADIVDSLVVYDLKVGKTSVLLNTGCLPASMFSPQANLVINRDNEVATPSMFVSLKVKNVSKSDVLVRAGVSGIRIGSLGEGDREVLKQASDLARSLGVLKKEGEKA